jgi:hypothetical protein
VIKKLNDEVKDLTRSTDEILNQTKKSIDDIASSAKNYKCELETENANIIEVGGPPATFTNYCFIFHDCKYQLINVHKHNEASISHIYTFRCAGGKYQRFERSLALGVQ